MNQSDFDDDSDEFDDDDDGYIPCPYCGETMLEAADYCPSCQRWITSEDRPAKKLSWWVIAIIVVLIGTMLLSTVGF